VEREDYLTLAEALDSLERHGEEIRGEGGLPEITALRRFAPEQRVAARLEISAPGFRGRDAGVDIRGDGSVIAYRGGVFRRELDQTGGETAYDAVRDELERS
jgi:hypothetical protein